MGRCCRCFGPALSSCALGRCAARKWPYASFLSVRNAFSTTTTTSPHLHCSSLHSTPAPEPLHLLRTHQRLDHHDQPSISLHHRRPPTATMKLTVVLTLAAALTQGTAIVVKRECEPICPPDNERPLCCSNMMSSTGGTGGLTGVSCDTRKSFEP